jgi:hypothetical protein
MYCAVRVEVLEVPMGIFVGFFCWLGVFHWKIVALSHCLIISTIDIRSPDTTPDPRLKTGLKINPMGRSQMSCPGSWSLLWTCNGTLWWILLWWMDPVHVHHVQDLIWRIVHLKIQLFIKINLWSFMSTCHNILHHKFGKNRTKVKVTKNTTSVFTKFSITFFEGIIIEASDWHPNVSNLTNQKIKSNQNF